MYVQITRVPLKTLQIPETRQKNLKIYYIIYITTIKLYDKTMNNCAAWALVAL